MITIRHISRAKRILWATGNYTVEFIESIDDDKAWHIINKGKKKTKKDTRIEICFTGFSDKEKESLIKLATENNFKVVGSVTVKLFYLCCGEFPGPAKVEKAVNQNVRLLTKESFLELIKNGNDESRLSEEEYDISFENFDSKLISFRWKVSNLVFDSIKE